jgi:hypothetical protein
LRWEKEKGLPVHTIPGGKRRTVYAFKHEVDAWLAKSPPAEEELSTTANLPKRMQKFWWRLPLAIRAVGGILLLVTGALGIHRYKERNSPTLTQILQQGNRLVAISPNSSVAWTFEFPFSTPTVMHSLVLPERGNKDEAGVLATVRESDSGGEILYYFSPRGELIWQYRATEVLEFASSHYKLSWGFHIPGTFQEDGETKLLLVTRDYTWWPSQLLVLNMRGKVESKFINSGWIFTAHQLSSARGRLLVVSGVSNSLDGGFLAVLDAHHFSATSPENPDSPFGCRNCPPDRPFQYFVFPRSELNVLTGSLLYPAGSSVAGSTLTVFKNEVPGDLGQGAPASVFEFSSEFQLLRANYDDHYWEWHRKLEKEGRIKHSREKCPEREGPPFIREWTPENGWREIRAANQTPKR